MSVDDEGRMTRIGLIADKRVLSGRPSRQPGFLSGLLGPRRRFVALLVAGFIIATLAVTFLTTDGSNATSTREGGGCSGCHDGAQTPAMLTVSGLPSGTYLPGQQYTIIVTITDTNGAGTGQNNFDIIANSGSFSTTDPNAEVNSPASGAEASANDAVSPMTATSWTVVWTAPTSGSAQIDVWAVMGDGASGTHDIWDHETYTSSVIPEFPVLLVPVIGVVVAVLLVSRLVRR